MFCGFSFISQLLANKEPLMKLLNRETLHMSVNINKIQTLQSKYFLLNIHVSWLHLGGCKSFLCYVCSLIFCLSDGPSNEHGRKISFNIQFTELKQTAKTVYQLCIFYQKISLKILFKPKSHCFELNYMYDFP